MQTIIDWLSAHPTFWQLILYPLLTAIITWALKPRTPEEYSALPPRVAAALKFIAAIGFDAPKAIKALSQVVTGKSLTPQAKRLDALPTTVPPKASDRP